MCPLEYYTYDDYKTWEGNWELIYGVPYPLHPQMMSPSPIKKHQQIAFKIAFELEKNKSCENCEVFGETDWKIEEDLVLKPDVVVVCENNNEDYITKAPEVVVEVISKSTARRDEKTKFEIYEKEKVKYYILAYPSDLKAKVYKLDGKTFDKVGDFIDEEIEITDIKCPTKIDFNEVFKRFRKGG